MTRIDLALDRMRFARSYSLRLIDDIPHDDWFRMPAGCPTHVAWQVGHLTIAEFRMFLFRYRGEKPGDDNILPPVYRTLFGIDSVPNPDSTAYPAPAEMRAVLDHVHAAVIAEAMTFDEKHFDEPLTVPHTICKTRGECLMWASMHEMIHGGQIGLLRRLLGNKPQW